MSQMRELPASVSNMIRVGTVMEVQAQPPRIRVMTGEIQTDWIRWGEQRAGADINTWTPPAAGEQVVLLCPEGDIAQAIAVCSLPSDDQPPPGSATGLQRTRYADGTQIDYDTSTSTLTVQAGAGGVSILCGNALLQATDSITLDTPTITCSGAVEIAGDATVGNAASGTFKSQDGKTITVTKGIVTKIQ